MSSWSRQNKAGVSGPRDESSPNSLKLTRDRHIRSTVIGANLQLVDSQTAFFYCVRSEAERERANPIEIIRALLRQLASCEPDLPIRQPVIDAYDTRKKKADRDGSKVQKLDVAECVKLMLELTREIPTVVIVDALDESDDPDYALISVLNQVLVRSEGLVKIFLSSRDNYNVVGGPVLRRRTARPETHHQNLSADS